MLGSKIENLIKLKEHNFNVPNFFILKHEDVIKTKIPTYELTNKTNEELLEISNKLKEEIEQSIELKYTNELNTKYYAVRSSSSLEDGDLTSFAGQFDTYLNVEEKDLNTKIIECFKSLYNINVLEYMKTNNLDLSNLKMNVIVQEMINPDISGVLFTSNPQGIINESVISVSYGLGENVVADKGEITTYYYNLTDKLYYYDGIKNILSKEQIEELINISEELKKELGSYLDIEFSILNNTIYLLQTRKITTIDDTNLLILDNSNIVESYPGISLPLTCSFVNNVYSGVFKSLCFRVLKNKKEVEQINDVFNNMVGNVNGRVYYKISNWYTLLNQLPLSNKIIPIWEEMLGIKNYKNNNDTLKMSFTKKLRVYKNSIIEILKTPKNMEKLNQEFITINDKFYDKYNSNLTPQELKNIYDEIKIKLLSVWDVTLLNDLYAFLFTGLVKKRIKDDNLANKYISGISNIESLKPIKEMINIAYNYEFNSNEYQTKKEEYIKVYGDRHLEELKLESETFRTNPNLFDNKIIEYQIDKTKLEEMYNNINKSNDIKIKEGIITKYLIKKCMLGIKNREISRLNRSRIYGIVREIYLSFGKYYYESKCINEVNDIFYLKEEEIFNNIDELKDLTNLVSERKDKYKSFYSLPAYTRLIFTNNEFDKLSKNITYHEELINQDKLYGTPCSSGIVEGEVLVVDNINDIGDVKDKILITKMTDPGWVFLLATAKGVISEKGSLLSHTAIISRELKIPAIVGVPNLLKTIKSKDIIKMDATTGEIIIIKRGV